MILRRLSLLVCAVLTMGAAPPAGPSGRYEIVAIRAASDAAGTLGARQDAVLENLLGRRMTFGSRIAWFDDRFCARTSRVRPSVEAWSDTTEPNLSDLQIAPGPDDLRLNQTLVIDCGGRAAGSITRLLMVDRRVLVMRSPNGTAYVVLEQPLDRRRARAVEHGLMRAGFDPGPVDGRIDARSRRAVALFARGRGASYAFEQGVLTENVVVALSGR